MNITQHLKKIGKANYEKLSETKKELAKELITFEEKYVGKSVVCTEYQLGRGGSGLFTPNMKELRRNNCLIECAFYVKTNFDSETNGRLFVIDEAKTEKNLEAQAKFKVEQTEKQEIENAVGENVANAIKEIGKSAKQRVKKV